MHSQDSPSALPPVHDSIRQANELFRLYGPKILELSRIRRQMDGLREKTEASWKAMRDCGVVAACTRCDEEEGGSCCGAGIENRYGPVLLLANLLMDVALPMERRQSNGCLFLGQRGCSLQVRDVLCINYLCTRIQKMLPHEELVHLQTITGEEMDAVFLLHEALRQFLKSQTSENHE